MWIWAIVSSSHHTMHYLLALKKIYHFISKWRWNYWTRKSKVLNYSHAFGPLPTHKNQILWIVMLSLIARKSTKNTVNIISASQSRQSGELYREVTVVFPFLRNKNVYIKSICLILPTDILKHICVFARCHINVYFSVCYVFSEKWDLLQRQTEEFNRIINLSHANIDHSSPLTCSLSVLYKERFSHWRKKKKKPKTWPASSFNLFILRSQSCFYEGGNDGNTGYINPKTEERKAHIFIHWQEAV